MTISASLLSAWRLGRQSVKQFTRSYTPRSPYPYKQLIESPSLDDRPGLDFLFNRERGVSIANRYFKDGGLISSSTEGMYISLATLGCRKLTLIEAPLLPNLGRWNCSKFNNIKPPVAKYWLDTKNRFGSLRTK